ncbi:MAG: hypothetical protein JXR81_00005, partial [Candidatus Goldbacteria bacterium]|nr:hypothetical protein [Candidatus Goldiibacteriota bacterium]
MRKILLAVFIYIVLPCALFSSWVDVDGTGTTEVLIYPPFVMTSTFSVKYDSLNYPHVFWSDSGNLYYLKYNGTAWVDADGVGQSNMMIGTGESSALILDGADRAHVLWINYVAASSGYDVFYMKWNGSAWVDADGAGLADTNITNSTGNKSDAVFVLDSMGRPHVVYVKANPVEGDVFYLKWDGAAWVDADGTGTGESNISNSAGPSVNPDIEIDASDNPHIVYNESSGSASPNEIYYIKWNSMAWTDITGSGLAGVNISNDTYNSVTPKLEIDSLGYSHVAWLSDRNMPGAYNRDVYYLKYNGSAWVDVDGTGTGNIGVTGNPSETADYLAFDVASSGTPCLAWTSEIYDVADSPVSVRYAQWSGSAWTDPDGFTAGMSVSGGVGTSLDLDNLGRPGIMFRTGGPWISDFSVSFLQWRTDFTPTLTATLTATSTYSITQTQTATLTHTLTDTQTATQSITQTMTGTLTASVTLTVTWTHTAEPTFTPTSSITLTPSFTQTTTCTPTVTATIIWPGGEIQVYPNPFNIDS